MQTFLQNRPTYLTLLVLILCFIFCLAPLSAAAADKPSGMDFAAQFDQFAPDDSAQPPASQITKSRLKSMMLAQTEKTKKKKKEKKDKGPPAPADLAKNLGLTAQRTRSHTGLPIALAATVQDAHGATVVSIPITVKLSVT